MKTTLKHQIQIAFLILIEIIFLTYVAFNLDKITFYIIFTFFILNCVVLIWIFIIYKVFKPKSSLSDLESSDLVKILEFGLFSILEFDENYNIINTSGHLKMQHPYLNTKKVVNLHSNFSDFLISRIGKLEVEIDSHYYEVECLSQERILIFKNIDEITKLKKYKDESTVVIGLLNLDNFNDEFSYMDERVVSEVSATLRKMVNDWAFNHKVLLRRLRNDRYFMLTRLNELEMLKKEINSFLKNFKEKSHELGMNITVSLVFAYGSDSINDLDSKVNELLELAQARGGDQMIIHDLNKEVEYYGGNSETRQVKSSVRSKVISQSIIDLILESNRIFVFGHKIMDFDSMGSCLAISKLCHTLNKICYIVSESGGIESKLENVLKKNFSTLKSHQFISDTQATLLYEANDLVILVDHHKLSQSAASELVSQAVKIVVIDHHRRGSDFVGNPIITFLDSSASSVCEMMVDILKVCNQEVELNEVEANIMYTGILVDTNHFTLRTSSKTFEACAYLQEFNVDLNAVQESLNEDITDFILKTKISTSAYTYDNMMIATYKEESGVSRAILSQVADHLLSIVGIDASFVIGYIKQNQVGISARSNKNVNVQVIMEKMQGGGHFNGAAMQRDNVSVEEIEQELIEILEERKKE